MKRTYRKTVVRTIRQSLSRFLAIFAIVALGVGFLAGLLATTPDMRYSADRFFDETDLFDLRIVGTLGLTDEDVEAVRAIDGVEQVMPVYSADAIVNTPGGDGLVARIQSVPLDQIEKKEPQGYLNRMEVVEGRLPVKEDECVVEQGSDLHGLGFSVGDTLPISPENEDWEDTFARNELKVVGVVSTSAYFSIERESASVGDGTVDVVLYTGEQNFTLDVWTDIYVQVAGAKAYDSLTDAYTDYVDLTAQKIEDISGERSRIRYEQVKTEAEEALADATTEYEDAKAEAEQKLADAEEELGDGRSEIEENEKKLENAQKEIDSGQAELDANKESLPGTLSAKQQQLADAQAKLIDAKAEYEAGVAQVEQKSQELESAKQQLEQAKQLERDKGYTMKEDSGRGWRRVVPSPSPKRIVEIGTIKTLWDTTVSIACGGGGIPVVEREDGSLEGVAAVIDKDLAACRLAQEMEADILMILTEVPAVAIHFGKPNQENLGHVTAGQLEEYAAQGQFGAGSMLPKVQAAIDFVRSAPNRTAFITSLDLGLEALSGRAGTKVTA